MFREKKNKIISGVGRKKLSLGSPHLRPLSVAVRTSPPREGCALLPGPWRAPAGQLARETPAPG